MPKQKFAAKYRIKGAKNWAYIYFWAKNDKDANEQWERDFKYDWSSMEYALEKIEEEPKKNVKQQQIVS